MLAIFTKVGGDWEGGSASPMRFGRGTGQAASSRAELAGVIALVADPRRELALQLVANGLAVPAGLRVEAIGRRRGINRSVADPLEVHLLADVAPPLVYDWLLSWEIEQHDIVQRMLLAGVAVDSPADAAELRPALFQGAEQAKKAFKRAGFKRQNPMSISYREMSLK